jgi:predicted nuclease of predicted toxin-antitoxin system
MKLLFDHNLSHKLVSRLADLFPQASHTRMADLTQATDRVVWDFARRGDFVIVTLDADFFDLLNLYGPPPRVIWIRCGNQPTAFYEQLLRARQARIAEWLRDPVAGGLEIYAEDETTP